MSHLIRGDTSFLILSPVSFHLTTFTTATSMKLRGYVDKGSVRNLNHIICQEKKLYYEKLCGTRKKVIWNLLREPTLSLERFLEISAVESEMLRSRKRVNGN